MKTKGRIDKLSKPAECKIDVWNLWCFSTLKKKFKKKKPNLIYNRHKESKMGINLTNKVKHLTGKVIKYFLKKSKKYKQMDTSAFKNHS